MTLCVVFDSVDNTLRDEYAFHDVRWLQRCLTKYIKKTIRLGRDGLIHWEVGKEILW